ncbi:CUB and zona pellucida-like domain-containing protein 1 [Eleutherodactylus coqui]|uniref:CUB and zona pellucida-like domain-containing protein 1 n=1 Tax=Eleutherodactylus coqui TaxID=57060 RepID=UPI003462C73A
MHHHSGVFLLLCAACSLLQAFSDDGYNLASNGITSQSSLYETIGASENAIDGSPSADHMSGHCTHTKLDIEPWWMVDLMNTFNVTKVKITNRGDCCSKRLDGAEIRIGNFPENGGTRNPTCAKIESLGPGKEEEYICRMVGQYVTITIPGRAEYLTLCEVKVYGTIVSEGYAEPECSIRCLPDIAEYILPYSLVSDANLDALNIHLKDPLCRAKKEKDHYLIRIPYTRCGSNVLHEDGKTFYANTIYGTIPDTDVHRIEIPVKCEMESNKTLELIINPKVKNSICKSYYNISMRLYQSDSFTEPITQYPHEIDLHSNLHVELEVESEDEQLQIFIETFIASPSLEETNRKYKVISQGCQVDSTLRVHPVTDRRLQRFSFHAFKFDNFREVYLFCNVIICHNSTSPNRCTQECIPSRRRREVHTSKEQVDSARLSQGPLVFVSEEKPAHGGSSTLASVLSVVLCVTVISAVLGLVVQKEYYRRQQRVLLQSSSDCS